MMMLLLNTIYHRHLYQMLKCLSIKFLIVTDNDDKLNYSNVGIVDDQIALRPQMLFDESELKEKRIMVHYILSLFRKRSNVVVMA